MTALRLQVFKLNAAATLPNYQTDGAAGLDLAACLPDGALIIEAGKSARVPTGLSIALPAGHEGQVRPRSGLAAKHSVTVLNAPGTIDEDYRGELQVLLINLGSVPYTIRHAERIAQLIVAPVTRIAVVEVQSAEALGATTRNAGGFGSTGS